MTGISVDSFFLGGSVVELSGRPVRHLRFTESAPVFTHDPNGRYMVGQAYVQAFRPRPQGQGRPLLFHHGGGMSGAMWETTPDGRPGWLSFSLQRNYPTYVLDNAGRGRAGWPAVIMDQIGEPLMRSAEEAWNLFRFGPADAFEERAAFAGQRFPVDALEDFTKQFVPRWLGSRNPNMAATVLELMEETGPAWIVTHSQGAEPVLQAVRQRPDLAAALVLMEPSDLPDDPGFLARADIPVLLVSGDYLDRSALWRELDERFDQLIADIRGAGGRADRLDLTAAIGAGFSHMAMMDHGHDRVFDVVDAWLQKNGDPTAAVTDPQTLK